MAQDDGVDSEKKREPRLCYRRIYFAILTTEHHVANKWPSALLLLRSGVVYEKKGLAVVECSIE